jgi:hypothetical protein
MSASRKCLTHTDVSTRTDTGISESLQHPLAATAWHVRHVWRASAQGSQALACLDASEGFKCQAYQFRHSNTGRCNSAGTVHDFVVDRKGRSHGYSFNIKFDALSHQMGCL